MRTYREEATSLRYWCDGLGETDRSTNHLCSEWGGIGAMVRRMRPARRSGRRMPLLLSKAIKRRDRKSRPARLRKKVLKNRGANRDKGGSCVC